MDVENISIPKSLYNRILKIAEDLDVNVNELIIDMLREAVSRYEEEIGSRLELSEEEVKKIKDRLRSLGYLD